MPQVAPLTKRQKFERQTEDLNNFILAKLYDLDIPQKAIANELGISQQSVSYRIKKCSFSYFELLVLLDLVGATEEDMIRYLAGLRGYKIADKKKARP